MAAELDLVDRITSPPRGRLAPAPTIPEPSRLRGFRLSYVAPFCYSPRGSSAVAERSRRFRDLVKNADPTIINLCMTHLTQLLHREPKLGYLTSNLALVPIPPRLPLRAPHPITVPEAIANALLGTGIGRTVWPALIRSRAMPKSAWSRPGSRPEFLEHCASLTLLDRRPAATRILLVDDFITRGRTLLSAAAVMRRAFPSIEIHGFALVRTEGLHPDIDSIRCPAIGCVRYLGGDAFRSP